MSNSKKEAIISALLNAIEIPPSYYDKVEGRYRSLGDWFAREGASTASLEPHIYPQGSFRLGTVIRPLNDGDSYDLDIGCCLESGISPATHTQKQLKLLVGRELEGYRLAHNFQRELEEKPRCWRLDYADEVSFHMDVVPSIPDDWPKRASVSNSMFEHGVPKPLSDDIASFSGRITDNRDRNYSIIDLNWRSSNPQGYAIWFEARMQTLQSLSESVAFMAKEAQLDELPTWRWRSPLQLSIQLLKRHRDWLFKTAPDAKPISAILTTLAGIAYQGEPNVASAIDRILTDMHLGIQPTRPVIPNPVDWSEDYAEKWYDPHFAHLRLRDNFYLWLEQARADFRAIEGLANEDEIKRFAERKFGTRLAKADLDQILSVPSASFIPKTVHVLTGHSPRPWRK